MVKLMFYAQITDPYTCLRTNKQLNNTTILLVLIYHHVPARHEMVGFKLAFAKKPAMAKARYQKGLLSQRSAITKNNRHQQYHHHLYHK